MANPQGVQATTTTTLEESSISTYSTAGGAYGCGGALSMEDMNSIMHTNTNTNNTNTNNNDNDNDNMESVASTHENYKGDKIEIRKMIHERVSS